MIDSDLEDGELKEDHQSNKIKDEIHLPQKRYTPISLNHEASPIRHFTLVNSVSEKIKPYKLLPCKYFAVGTCHRGQDWTYVHANESKALLCPQFLRNECKKEDNCEYSHEPHKFPWKYLFATGYCQSGTECRFSHVRIKPGKLLTFMEQNEQFLIDLLQRQGTTLLGEAFLFYLCERNKLPQPIFPNMHDKDETQPQTPELDNDLNNQLELSGILKNTLGKKSNRIYNNQ